MDGIMLIDYHQCLGGSELQYIAQSVPWDERLCIKLFQVIFIQIKKA